MPAKTHRAFTKMFVKYMCILLVELFSFSHIYFRNIKVYDDRNRPIATALRLSAVIYLSRHTSHPFVRFAQVIGDDISKCKNDKFSPNLD